MGDIVQSARKTFFGDKSWVYGQNHGGASNPNAFKGNQADCTYLVYQSNLHAGYNVPYLSTGGLIKNGTISPEAAKYYEVVDAKDARPGDTVYYPAAAQNANHVMVLTSWDSSKNTGVALGAQSEKSDLKDGIKIGADKDYWKAPTLILRPKAETYVPELDLTGGPGTGIGSARVAAAVNLLKTEGAMEGYRPGIYTDSGGVPTVGNGLALVVNGSKGWTVRSEEEIKGLLRIAGLPESKYDELPLDTLKQAAQDLRSGNTDSARARFGDGRSPDTGEFSVSPLQADRLTAAFIVADTTPKLIAGLGGPTTYNELANGEFAAVAGGTYQNPNWLKNHPDFVKAFKEGDDAAAQAAFGTSKRGVAEAEAYAGHVSTSNENLSPGTSSPGERTTSNTPAGHWEYPNDAYYDPHTGIQVGGSAPVWVSDTASTSNSLTPGAGRGLINPPSVNPDSAAPTLPKLPPTPQISPDGTTALLPNGQVIRAGTGGTLDIDANGNLVVSRPAQGWTNADGSPSDIRQITTYDAKGAQLGTTIAQNLPGESSPVENYAQRTVQVHNPDGSTSDVNTHFQAGVGWVDDAGKTVLSLKDAQAQLDAKNAHLILGASADNDYTPGAPTGEAEARDYMGKTPAQQANRDSGGGFDAEPDPHSTQGHGGSETPSDFHTALLDAFNNPTLPNPNGPTTQYAGPGLPEIATASSPAPEPNPNSLSSYFQSQGTALTPKQQDALASQINQLKLGSSDDLSFYRLPDGSTLIANADGDLVGQLGAPRNGEISLRANAIGQDGSATTHERTITTDGQATSHSPQALAQANAGLSLMQGLDGLQHWDQMGDVARFTSLVGLAGSFNTLSDGTLSSGSMLGQLVTAASVLSISQGAVDGEIDNVLGINGFKYAAIALSLNDFEKYVDSRVGTLEANKNTRLNASVSLAANDDERWITA